MNRLHVPFLDLLPESVRHAPEFQAAAAILDAREAELREAIRGLVIWPRLDEQSGPILVHLATRMHVDAWDGAWSDAQRRQAIRDSPGVHRFKGTPGSVGMAISVFAGVRVQEWFEYGGQPYRFRLYLDSRAVDDSFYADMLAAVRRVKNARSHLEAMRLERESVGVAGLIGVLHVGRYLTMP